ncbi:hypothetical protein GCM10010282_60540 [Streptomyces roseolus]|nr:hypothetical protein GCM10010282_60540 [Streptomyces roseolus]
MLDPMPWISDPPSWAVGPVFWALDPLFWMLDPVFWMLDPGLWGAGRCVGVSVMQGTGRCAAGVPVTCATRGAGRVGSVVRVTGTRANR